MDRISNPFFWIGLFPFFIGVYALALGLQHDIGFNWAALLYMGGGVWVWWWGEVWN